MSGVLTRAHFLRLTSSTAAGLVLAIGLDGCWHAPRTGIGDTEGDGAGAFSPSAWLRIDPDDRVTVVLAKAEMGQGVATGLPTLIAEELDYPLERIAVAFAPSEARFAYPQDHGRLLTGGSTSMRSSWKVLRQAGATARAMLIAAAAARWGVSPASLTTRDGAVIDPAANRRATYGSLAATAAQLPVPANVPLKTPDQFRLIGKTTVRRLDVPAKVDGSAVFGMDVKLPGMKYAAIAMPPAFGGKVRSYDDRAAKAIRGVVAVVQVPQGVAVVADNTWAAFEGKRALQVVWDHGVAAQASSEQFFAESERLARDPSAGVIATTIGDVEHVAGRRVEAIYRGPYLAHATMEPMNATADVRDGRCEVWVGTQSPTVAQLAAAQYAGLPLERCIVHNTYLGGGFGRRTYPDAVGAAVAVSKTVGMPVKVVYTREDDTQHDFYRPMSVNAIAGVLDDRGNLVGLSHTVVSESVFHWFLPSLANRGWDRVSMDGAAETVYHIPNFTAKYVDYEPGVPVGFWRAPDANWNIFVLESFMDELAATAGKDPVAFRLALLGDNPRAANVLRLAALHGGWNGPARPGVARGVAIGPWNGSLSAMVAEVSMTGSLPHVHHVTAVADCGQVVNPDVVRSQMESAIYYGLSAALSGKITIRNGRVEQGNFDTYTVLHMDQAPGIDVITVDSHDSPTGIGELGVPAIAPAVANAVFAATGKRFRSLPFSDPS